MSHSKEVTKDPLSSLMLRAGLENKSLTLKEIVQTPPVALATIKQKFPDVPIDALEYLVADLADSLNRGKNLNGDQVKEIARLIMKEYFYLSIQDFQLCFEMLKMNKFPEIKILDSFDVLIIFQVIEKYIEKKRTVTKQVEDERRLELYKEWDEKAVPMPQEVKDFVLNLWKKNRDSKPVRTDFSEEAKLQKEIINEIMQEFNGKADHPETGKPRTITIEENIFTFDEYLHIRYHQLYEKRR